MAACLVIVVHAALLRHDRQERLDALRAEQRQIAAELQDVKRVATPNTEPPVVVLENDEGTRVIVELNDDDTTSPTPTKVMY